MAQFCTFLFEQKSDTYYGPAPSDDDAKVKREAAAATGIQLEIVQFWYFAIGESVLVESGSLAGTVGTIHDNSVTQGTYDIAIATQSQAVPVSVFNVKPVPPETSTA